MDDLLQLDRQLQDDERMIRDSVSRFVENDVTPLMEEAFEHGHFPLQLVKKSAELGLLGLTLPSEYGGAEASYVAYGLVCQELERGDAVVFAVSGAAQSSLCMYLIYCYGNEEPRKLFSSENGAAGQLDWMFWTD